MMHIKTLVFLLLLSLGQAAFAQVVASVTHLSGLLSVKRPDGSTKLLSVKSAIEQGDLLTTERDTFARLKFADASEIVLRPGSQLKIEKFNYEAAKPEADSLVFNMLKGGMRAVSGLIGKRSKGAVAYTTPTATIGIRGTHFGALLCQGDCDAIATASGKAPADGLYLDVARGAVIVTNAAGSMLIETGQFGYVRDRVTAPAVVPPEQGLQVTMPDAISHNDAAVLLGKASDSSAAQCVVE